MKTPTFCVVGAGAIGAYVGAALARGGARVTLVARGAHLAAMRANGVTVHSARGDFHATVAATDDPATVGPVDCAIVALKAHQIVGMLPKLSTLIHSQTRVMSMQNGIPWWYFQGRPGPLEELTLESVDPGGTLARAFDYRRVIGCVIYSSTELAAPGIVRHVEGTRYALGSPSGAVDAELEATSAAFVAGGLKAPIETDLRPQIWVKLLGNASLNPISAITRATIAEMTGDPGTSVLIREIMAECVAVAAAAGIDVPISIDKRFDGARRVGHHKTSMLQDVEAGRPLELDVLSGAIVELGERLSVPTPATRHVHVLAKQLDASLGAPERS